MAASLFQKLLRNQSQPSTATRLIISHLTTTTTATATATATHQPPVTASPIKTQSWTQPKSQESPLSTHSSHIFPSFSFGYFLNPSFSAGFSVTHAADGVVSEEAEEDSRTIWADSVKKKRKRKMNKHKLKKLRKSLRRKT